MKKCFIFCLFTILLSSASFAQLLIGGRAAGMGGAGVACSTDLSAAYYNPAALMRSPVKAAEVKISLGAEYTDPTELSNAISKMSDTGNFIADNYSKTLNFRGSLDGIIGFNIKKIGLSVIPVADLSTIKLANSLIGVFSGAGMYYGVLTLGKTFSTPFLPAALDVGINTKFITAYYGNLLTVGTPTSANGISYYGNGSGMGFDVGLLTSFWIPGVSELKVGAVARNLAQTINYSNKYKTETLTYSGATPVVTSGPEVSMADSATNYQPAYAIGTSAVIPVVNLLAAGDYEMTSTGSSTHIGLEYPLLNIIILRTGIASGAGLSKTTFGAKINLPILTLDGVIISDANNSGTTAYVLDVNMGW